MRFTVVTIFPEAFDSFLRASLLGKAVAQGLVQVDFVDPRAFAADKHHTVDDTPYGGGDGMVIKVDPLVAALESVGHDPDLSPHRVLLTPQGEPLAQRHLVELLDRRHVVLVCGRYEGFDERIRTFVHQELSLGDFVLNGGEVAAMAIIDGVSRLVPGVIGKASSLTTESHGEGLLEYPQYTRPREFRGLAVPEVLVEGNHARIDRWRRLQMLVRTRQRRPDLWERYQPSGEDRTILAEVDGREDRAELAGRAYVALLHYPVYDKGKRIVTTAITNLDLHDIARSSRTFGLGGYFVVTPVASQQELARRILAHWKEGHGASYNEDRAEALALLEVVESLEQVLTEVEAREGKRPLTVATSAAARPGQVTGAEVRRWLGSGQPVVIMMGTGWGLATEVLERADLALRPVHGGAAYNHLSVRSAAAILLDRLFGLREET
ncbi:MAG: tRNA (guanosine(37)-N1)-methyltransferase TrmD [Deltaproteobacteria bacterium]|nr:tRNA (guanosine(37)-N1)-methyltransferase TrmD [Deltaproteobacteria bacterium]